METRFARIPSSSPPPYDFSVTSHHLERPTESELSRGARAALARNGFVVLTDWPVGQLAFAYLEAEHNFITSDSVLYVFEALFRGGFHDYEQSDLMPATRKLVSLGLAAVEEDWRRRQGQLELREAARRNLVFFAVVADLLGQAVPAEVAPEAKGLADKVRAANETKFYPGEDYTLYKVRGDYAGDPDREAYFRATKWLSRQILPILPGTADQPAEADEKLRQGVLLGRLLQTDPALRKAWDHVYSETGYFLGRPDSFTPLELAQVADRLLPKGYAEGAQPALATAGALQALRAECSKPTYRASAIIPVPAGAAEDVPSKYVQFLGERYIADGAIMQQTCAPYVAERYLPTGLDVAATLFGSDRAVSHLTDEFARYPPLRPQVQALRTRFAAVSAAQYDTLYDGWVGALRMVNQPVNGPVPSFLKTDAWRDKCLGTSLASWAQMRHDFILYAKQPMVPACAGMGFLVDPLPDFYQRMEALATALDKRGFAGMKDFATLCNNLRRAAQAELAGQDPYSASFDKDFGFFINSFGQWLLQHFTPHVGQEQPALVADVASNWRGDVLHAATGPLYPIIAKGELRGQPIYYTGFVMSYHEFTTDRFRRWTDQEWVAQVNRDQAKASLPAWTAAFAFPPPPQG